MATYNPARIAQSYTAGLESGERRKIRGLDQERIRKEEAAKAKQAARQAEIEGLTSRYALGDETAERGLMGYGPEGIAAATGVQEYQLGQTAAKRETQQFDRETSERELTQSMAQALTITDPSEWDQYEAWARPRSLAAGTSEEMYDQIANMPMAEAQNFLRQQMSGEPKAAPSGGIKNVKMPDGSTPAFDITNPEQRVKYQDAIAAGGTDVPSKQLVGKLASGGKAEQRELNTLATSTNTLLRNLDRAVETLKVEPASGQIVGDLALFANNMASNLKTIAGQSDVSDRDLTSDIEHFSGLIEPIAGATSELNSVLIDAAYAKALIQNGSRPTDADYKSAYKSLTGGAQNPKILIKNLKRASKDLGSDFRFRYRESTGSDWAGKFDIESEEKTSEGVSIPANVSGINTADMPDGKEIKGPDGVVYIKEGGSWRKKQDGKLFLHLTLRGK